MSVKMIQKKKRKRKKERKFVPLDRIPFSNSSFRTTSSFFSKSVLKMFAAILLLNWTWFRRFEWVDGKNNS